MSNFQAKLKGQSPQEYNETNIAMKLFRRAKSIDISNGHYYLTQFLETSSQLRGGGCAIQKTTNALQQKGINAIIPLNFATNLRRFTNIIVEKSNLYQDKIYQDEILQAFQWFFNHKEFFQVLCNDQLLNSINYKLIEQCVEQLVKQLPLYLKLSGFLFHSLLQIINDLLRVIFTSQLKNEDIYIQVELQQSLLNNISEIQEQIKVESSKLWITGIDFELQMIKTCITHFRTNSGKGQELLLSFLCQVANSVSQLSPTSELIDTIIEGGKFLLMNFYDKQIKHPLEKYEIYYFFENLKWSLVNQLKQGYSITKTIIQLQKGYCRYIQQSKDWMIHFCWINLLFDIMSYRPILSKKEILEIQKQKQLDHRELFPQSQFTQVEYDKSLLKIKLFHDEKSNFQNLFGELRLFQVYSLEKQEKIQLLPNYLNFKFDNKEDGQINNEDLNIQILTKELNLEILNSLNNLLLSSTDAQIQNFKSIDMQLKRLKSSSTIQNFEKQEVKESITEIIRKLKQQSLLILFALSQVQLLVIREIEIDKIFLLILEKEDNNLSQNVKSLKEQLLQTIKESQLNYLSQLTPNIKNIVNLLVKNCQYIAIYQSEYLFSENNEFESLEQHNRELTSNQFHSTIVNLHNFLKQFIGQIKKSKKIFKQIYEKTAVNQLFQNPLSQAYISEIAIQLYHPNVILYLNAEFQDYYKKYFQTKCKLETEEDLIQSFILCYLLQMIFKIIKRLILMHKQNLAHLTLQKNHYRLVSKLQSNNFESNSLNTPIIESLMIEKRSLIQKHFDKYNDKELTDQETNDLSLLQKQVALSIKELKFKKWPLQQSTIITIFFSEILNKLQILELNYKNKDSIKKEIFQLFEIQITKYYEQGLSIQQIQVIDKGEENEQEIIPELFNCELVIQNISLLISKSQKVKKIIQQKYFNIGLSKSIPNTIILENTWQTFKLNINEALQEIQELNQKCSLMFSDKGQLVFDQSFIQQLSTTKSFDQINANILLFNTQTFLDYLNSSIDQEIQNDKKLSFVLSELKTDFVSKQGKGILDLFEDSSYKVRESLAYHLIKIQSIVLESPIQEFCSKMLQDLWILENHESVRNILKNEEMIQMQKRLFSQDLTTFSNSLQIQIQTRLKGIEQLETLVLIGDNQTEMKKQLQQAYDDLETYLDNITDMSQRLDISLVFLREIKKDLKKIKTSIDQLLQSVKGLENDIRKLRGKDFMELLQIRKEKILKQMLEKQLDQVHIQIKTQEYDPMSGGKIKTSNGNDKQKSYLLKPEHNDFDGEINEFLWRDNEKQKDVMLLRGKAGSGKSRASSNIEELLWIYDKKQPCWIPIFVSLPSLKDPRHNLINQALESENYNFDNIQIRDLKEAISNGKLKVLFILESYDEIKTDFIRSNIYQTNRFAQDLNIQVPGQNVKIIVTTREEILTSIGYQTWFYGQSINTLKEVELLPFVREQSQEYIKIYIKISVKRTIKRFYDFLKQLKGQPFLLDEFKEIWSNLEGIIDVIIIQKQIDNALFSSYDAERLVKKLQQIEFFNFIKTEQMTTLKKELLQLWSEQKFSQVIENVNINHLLCTPFMMEIIVYVLPKMSQQFSQATYIRDVVTKNYLILKRQANQSKQLIHQLKNNEQIQQQIQETSENKKVSQKQNLNQIKSDKVILEQFHLIMEELDNQNFFESFSITNQLEYINSSCFESTKNFYVKFDANLIVAAFKLNQLTAFDFYETFVDYYSNQQIEKLKDLGKVINPESFYIDLQDFSLYLAIDMSMRQITQVNYKQKGKLQIQNVHEERNDQKSWDDLYFDEILDNPEYKSQLRKCMLINAKDNLYAFNHKSIQDYFVAKYILKLYQSIFDEHQGIDVKSLEKSIYNNQLFNLSQEHYFGVLELLKPKLILINDIKKKLILMTQLSKKDSLNKVSRSASNSIYLLSYLGEYLENIDFSNISISNTKINELTLFSCDLSHSQFKNVSIDSCNFNCATIKNVKWKKLICKEKRILSGHNQTIISIDFTEDGQSVISVSKEGLIKRWLIYSNEDPKSLNLNDEVKKTSYSKTCDVLICQTNYQICSINCQNLIIDEVISLPNYQYQDIILQPEMQYLAAYVQRRNKIYLWQIKDIQQKNDIQPMISQSQNKSPILCLAATSDFKFIATGGEEIKLWKGENCKEYQEVANIFKNSKYKTQSILFSQDEQILISGGEDCRIRFWNFTNTQKIQLQFQLDTLSPINFLSYQVQGKFLTVRTQDYIKLYDAQNPMKAQNVFRSEIDFNYKVFHISPNCKSLAISKTEKDNKSTITIWDISDYSNMKQLSSFGNQEDQIRQLQFSPDGQVLVSVTMNSVYLWNVKQNKLISKLENQFNNIQNLSFSSDQYMFSICSNDKKLTLWNIQQLEQPQNVATLSLQHEGCKAYFCPYEQLLISYSKKSEPSGIMFWDSKQYILISTEIKDEIIRDISFNAEGTTMISFSNSVRIWKKNQSQFQIQAEYRLSCNKINKSFMINDQRIIVLKDTKLFEIILSDNKQINEDNFGYQETVLNFDFASNGQFLIVNGSNQSGLLLFLIDQQQQSIQFKDDVGKCNDFSISQDFSIIAIANNQGTRIQNMNTKQLICYQEEKKICTCVCFYQQQENKFLIIGSKFNEGQLSLYDTNDSTAINKILTFSLPCYPQKIQYLEKQQQVIILFEHFLTLHQTDNFRQTNIILIKSAQTISNNFFLNQDQTTIGLGVNNEICFYSLSNIINTELIPTLDKTKILYIGFSKYNQTLNIITDGSIYIEWDLNQNKIVKQGDFKIRSLSQIVINEYETQLIAFFKYSDSKQKLSTIDLNSMKSINFFEELIIAKVICLTAVYTQDGTSFVTGYSNRTFKFWDSKSCQLLQMFNSYTSTIDLIKISNRGIMAQSNDNKIKLWNLIALKQQQSQKAGHSDQINRLIVSPDGLSLVSGSESEIIRWDLKEMKMIDLLIKGQKLPSYFSFSSDGQYLAALEEGGWIKVWKITSLHIIEHCFRLSYSNDTLTFQFNNENNQLISKNKENQILIWDLEKAYLCKKLPNSEVKPEESITILSSDAKLVVTSNPLKIIYPDEQIIFMNDKMKIGAITISHDSKLIAIEDINKSIIIWSVESMKCLHKFENKKKSKILAIAFSRNNKNLLSTHDDEIVRLWNVVDGDYQLLQEVQIFQYKKFGSVQTFPVDEDNFITLWSEYWGYDELFEYFLSYYYWQSPQRKDIQISPKNTYYNFTAGYSEHRKMFAIQLKISLHLYDINTNQIVAILEGSQLQEQNLSTVISFSYDGSQLITKGVSHILKLWDISDINDIKQKINFKQIIEVKAAQFLMDGETIRIIGKDGTINNYNIQQFTQICRIPKQQQFEFLDTYSGQCKQFKADFKDLELNIIDVVTNEITYTFQKFSSNISNLTFTPSGQQFILGMEDGSIFLYRIDKYIIDKYKRPVCYKVFAKSAQLQADFCHIEKSIFETQDKENLQKLFIEKGALTQ